MKYWLTPLLIFLTALLPVHAQDMLPEQEEINAFIAQPKPPPGIVFVVHESDEEALEWLLPRVIQYSEQLRLRFPKLSLILLSHGDEMHGWTQSPLNQEIKKLTQKLVKLDVRIEVCGSFAQWSGLDESDFPGSIDVIPYAPQQIQDYRSLDYEIVSMELTW